MRKHPDSEYGWSSQQHQSARAASVHGYKIAEGVAIDQFAEGEGIIILNLKGEPMLVGQVEQLGEDDDGIPAVLVGGNWWPSDTYFYRRT